MLHALLYIDVMFTSMFCGSGVASLLGWDPKCSMTVRLCCWPLVPNCLMLQCSKVAQGFHMIQKSETWLYIRICLHPRIQMMFRLFYVQGLKIPQVSTGCIVNSLIWLGSWWISTLHAWGTSNALLPTQLWQQKLHLNLRLGWCRTKSNGWWWTVSFY